MNLRGIVLRRGWRAAAFVLTLPWIAASVQAQGPTPSALTRVSARTSAVAPTITLDTAAREEGLTDDRVPGRAPPPTQLPDPVPQAETPAPAFIPHAPTQTPLPVQAQQSPLLPPAAPTPVGEAAPAVAPSAPTLQAPVTTTAPPSLGLPISPLPLSQAADLLDIGGIGGGSCASCGGHGGGGCSSCGGGGGCIPGRLNSCSGCDAHTAAGRLLCGLYQCFCCPDPCYTPRWIPEANAAFFVDPVRPVTQTRLRYDAQMGWVFPDKGEMFWAKIGGKGPKLNETRLNAHVLTMYQEIAATPSASAFVEYPYLSLWPEVNPHTAGFGDINIGTKTVLFDCELAVLAFQFRTYIPSGNPGKGLGTGHVSLEPSILGYLKLAEQTYLQGQVSEWIPLGGDPDYQGALIRYNASVNHVLGRLLPDVLVIGTAEFTGYTFQDGAFTDPVLGPYQGASGTSYLTLGPGLRVSVCNRMDFGFGAAFSLDGNGPAQIYRTELRLRF